jgi:hypothetical protein
VDAPGSHAELCPRCAETIKEDAIDDNR